MEIKVVNVVGCMINQILTIINVSFGDKQTRAFVLSAHTVALHGLALLLTSSLTAQATSLVWDQSTNTPTDTHPHT